ncbi:uncharacterized protein LOC113212823 isoform X2 [Frankliniella occidentalis]|nr:uncharacterized protein LOC113212823 isoform X2 [Frankliniella occidentalis]
MPCGTEAALAGGWRGARRTPGTPAGPSEEDQVAGHHHHRHHNHHPSSAADAGRSRSARIGRGAPANTVRRPGPGNCPEEAADTARVGHRRSVVPGVATRTTRITTSRGSTTSNRQRRNHRGTSPTMAGGAPQDTHRERRGQDCVVGARFTAGHGSPLRGARSRLW